MYNKTSLNQIMLFYIIYSQKYDLFTFSRHFSVHESMYYNVLNFISTGGWNSHFLLIDWEWLYPPPPTTTPHTIYNFIFIAGHVS
jgi:hypothetical protein